MYRLWNKSEFGGEKKRTKKVLHFLCGVKTFSELCCFPKTFEMVLTQFI